MSPRTLLLAATLAANIALAFALAQRPAVRAYFSSSPSSAPAATAAHAARTASPATSDALPDLSESWAQLTSGDLPDVVARLRAGGVPPNLIRLIVGALVAERFADRHKALFDAVTAKPWWQGQAYEAYSDPKITAMRRQLAREERDLVTQLLGSEIPTTDYDRAWAQQRYGNLPPEKIESLRRINGDYDDLMAEIRDRAKGIILPEDREKLAYLEQEKRADVAKLLSADELLEVDLHSGPTAKRLRDQLVAFDPTEEEYRAIFQIQHAVDAQFADGRTANLTQEQRRQRRDLAAATGDQIKAVLSPERYAEYQLKTDPAFVSTSQFVTGLNLPPTAATQVVTVQKDIMGRYQAISADRTLPADQRASQLAVLAQEATTTLTATLGEKGVAAYKQQGPGGWLTIIEQRAQPRKAAPKQ